MNNKYYKNDVSNCGIYAKLFTTKQYDTFHEYIQNIELRNQINFASKFSNSGETFKATFGFEANEISLKLHDPRAMMKTTTINKEIINVYFDKYKTECLRDYLLLGAVVNIICLTETYKVGWRNFLGEYLIKTLTSDDIIFNDDGVAFFCDKIKSIMKEYSESRTKSSRVQMAIDQLYSEIGAIKENLENLLKQTKDVERLLENKSVNEECREYTVSFEKLNSDELQNFFNLYNQTFKFASILDYSWGYSSGEMARLSLLSRLTGIESKNKNLLILMDEADMLLHPEWQREHIKYLRSGLKRIYQDAKSIQVIIATHSPIMLSDIPLQNTIFLGEKGNEVGETFSGNIFSLYQNAFFIDESGVGSFAEQKLKEIVGMIRDKNLDSDKEK